MTIFLMIVVNTPGAGATPYSPLLHAEWHGLTLTDLVFPSFLFAVGTAIPFAGAKWSALPGSVKWAKIFKRALVIFLIGYFLNWYTSMHWVEGGGVGFVSIPRLRVLGVLQRIALCYFFAAILSIYCSSRQLIYVSVGLLLSYWWLMRFGGEHGDAYSELGNLVRKIDVAIIGLPRMYVEHGVTFDPEGLLSTLPSIVNVLAGVLAGRLLKKPLPAYQKTTNLLVSGCAALLLGLCWHLIFPVNKKLWSSSFALTTVGIDMLVMGLLFYLHQVREFYGGVRFFSVLGRNPLAIYILSNLLLFLFMIPKGNTDLIDWFNLEVLQHWFPGPFGSLVFAVMFAMACWCVGWLLDRFKIYIRV